MERNVLTWNFPNWITVMLMAATGWGVIFLGSQLLQMGGSAKPASAPGS